MILITGYKGFIGQHLTKRLKEGGWIGIEREDCFERLDMISSNYIKEIWHLGAISDTTSTNINQLWKYNIDFTLELFDRAIAYKIPVKFASSASIFGLSKNRMINPLNYYAYTKAIVDKWIEDNIDRFANVQSYRLYNVYGEYEHDKYQRGQASPVYTFTQQAKSEGLIKIFENSSDSYRDFVWVEDVLDCMMIDRPSGFYDVGTSQPISFLDVAEMIANKYDASIKEIPFPERLIGKYQFTTRATRHFYEKQFTTVEEYLARL